MKSKNAQLSPIQLISGILLSLLFVLLSLTGSLNGLVNVFGIVFSGIKSDIDQKFNGFSNDFSFLFSITSVKQERDALQEEKIQLLSQINDLEKQIGDLKKQIEQKNFDLPYTLEPVRIISFDEFNPGEVLINKGSQSGLKVGDVVIYHLYAVGEIIEINENFSRVRLITSPESKIPAVALANQTKGILRGDIGNKLIVTDIINEAPLKEGDVFVTSGVNSNFPFGLRLGEVTQIQSISSDVTKKAVLKTDLSFNDLRELFVINK